MKNSTWWVVAAIVCVAGIVAAVTSLRQYQDNRPLSAPDVATIEGQATKRSPIESPSLPKALGVSDDDMVEVGGVMRPKRDIVKSSIDSVKEREKFLASLPKIGTAPTVPNDLNETTKQLAVDLANPKAATAASSVFGAVSAFDRDSYLKDPKSWLEQTRPSRVFHSKPAGKDVVPIEHSSPAYQEILQGESVFFEAKAEPGMPVTFHTQQLGEFDNRLKTISVAASDEGVARVKYTAVSGVIGSVRIMAASPVHSGSLVYLVEVSVPN